MPDVENTHPSRRLTTPDGVTADIDLDMVPLVKALWALHLRTAGCCQDLGESIASGPGWAQGPGRQRHAAYYTGQAWLKMPVTDAQTMLGLLLSHPDMEQRLNRWTRPGAWEVFSYLVADEGRIVQSGWAQIHFPKAQIPEVIEHLRAATAA
ncbi:hypothetical protein [Actinomadura sediminis]|uniref:Uncharacterized protein n=1 Tax=Actinomadura sediminis TaxID=1038904 RepID=A0ABW3EYG8_9ACTN